MVLFLWRLYYIVLSQPELAKSSELAASSLFKLLGWAFAEEGRKCVPFGLDCEALGVVFNLRASCSGVCAVYNTEARVQEISTEINRVLEQGHISQVEAQKLRGRMQFAESQLYGRTGKRCICALRDFSCKRRSKIQEREATFLKLFVNLLKSDTPRQVFCENKHSVVIITDACYENDARDRVCGLGGVLVDKISEVRFANWMGNREECWGNPTRNKLYLKLNHSVLSLRIICGLNSLLERRVSCMWTTRE